MVMIANPIFRHCDAPRNDRNADRCEVRKNEIVSTKEFMVKNFANNIQKIFTFPIHYAILNAIGGYILPN